MTATTAVADNNNKKTKNNSSSNCNKSSFDNHIKQRELVDDVVNDDVCKTNTTTTDTL